MSTAQKTKKVASVTGKAVGSGILGAFNAIWKYGGKWLIVANVFSFICVAGLYNWISPDHTIVGYFMNGFAQDGFLTSPTTAGMLALTACMVGAIGYMANNTKRSLGLMGLICVSVILALLAYWCWTLGAFAGASIAFIATIAQASVSFILAFGLVYSKIDKIITGRANIDSTVVDEEE